MKSQKITVIAMLGTTVLMLAGCENEQAAVSEAVHEKLAEMQITQETLLPPVVPRAVNPPSTEKTQDMTDQIPIIMFHYVRDVNRSLDKEGYNLSIDPRSFEKILQYLSKEGYKTLHVSDLAGGTVPKKSIILSFDDGYEDFYTTALPLLKKYGFTASVAVITDKMDGVQYMSPAQITEIHKQGIEILSHTVHHRDLNKDPHQLEEIANSEYALESLLGGKITGFVYPSGKYDGDSLRYLKENGYLFALTEHPGYANLKKDLLQLRRIRIDNRDGYEGFVRKLTDENPENILSEKTPGFSILTNPQLPY